MEAGILPWQEALRPALILGVNASIATCIQLTALERKRSPLLLICTVAARCILLNLLGGIVFRDYIRCHPALDIFYEITITLQALLLWLVFFYTFKGSFLKIAMTSMATEIYTLILNAGVLILVNYLEGRPRLLDNTGEFLWMDLLIPAIMLIVFLPAYYSLRDKIRENAFKEKTHKKRYWIFLGIYFISGILSWWNGYTDTMGRHKYTFWILFILLAAGAGITGAESYCAYIKRMETEHKFLKKQQELLGLHRKAIYDQICQMEKNQKMIDSQMKEIEKLEGKGLSGKRVKAYLKSLKKEYHSIKAGVFCSDWKIDVILYYYADFLEKKEIPYSFSFSCYEKGCVDYEVIGNLLLDLLEKAIEKNMNIDKRKRKLFLTGGTVKNQLVLTLNTGGTNRLWTIRLKSYIKKYGGTLYCQKKGEDTEIKFMIPCSGSYGQKIEDNL